MHDNDDFSEYFEGEINHGRGHTMWPDFDKIKNTITMYHWLWDEGFINEGEFKPEVTLDEINDAIASEFGIKDYFDTEGDMAEGIDDMLNEMRNFAECYAR